MLFCSFQYVCGVHPLQKVASCRFPVKDSTSITDAISIVNSIMGASYASVREVSIVSILGEDSNSFPQENAPVSAVFPLMTTVGSFYLTVPYPKPSKSLDEMKTTITAQSNILGEVVSPYFKY